MNSADRKDVIFVLFEAIITIIVLLGGGFLIYSGKGTEIAIGGITLVLTFWFNRRQNQQQADHIQNILQSQQVQTPGGGSVEPDNKPTA